MRKKLIVLSLLMVCCFIQTSIAQVVTVITLYNGFNARRASVDDYLKYRTPQSRSDAANEALKTFIKSSNDLYYSSISFSDETIILCTYSERVIPVPVTSDHILYKFYHSHKFYWPDDDDYEHYKSAALSRSIYYH